MSTNFAVAMTIVLSVFANASPANHDESPKATFSALKSACQDANWKQILANLTPQAQKSIVQGSIYGAAAAMGRNFPPGPEGDAHRNRLKKLFIQYKIDKIKFPGTPDFSAGPPSKEVLKKMSLERKAYATQVLKVVPNHNQLLRDLSLVMADSPFPAGTTLMFRLGEITDIKVGKNSATAIVEVDPSRLSDDPTVINVMPPSPIKFQRTNGKWKYDGVDEIKQREIAESHMDLLMRDRRSGEENDFSFDLNAKKTKTGNIDLTADWVPFDDESTYGFAKKWPEINRMKPVAKTKSYDHSFFQSMTPPDPSIKAGDIWKINAKAMLPLLQQFHKGASCKLHHGGPTGAYGCLIGQKDSLVNILIRLHGEIRHEDGWYYTVSQFEGHLVWDKHTKKVVHFRLFVPPVRTNVDINRSWTIEEARNKTKFKGLTGVDIGFIPKMELAGGRDVGNIKWSSEVNLDTAKLLLAKKFYPSANIHWLPWEQAVEQSQKTGKPLHVVALFGTLFDESC